MVVSLIWLPRTCLLGDTLMEEGQEGEGSGLGKDGTAESLAFPVPMVEASPACTSAIVVEAETASQASEPASQASDEEDTPATDIYFVSPPGALITGPSTHMCSCMHIRDRPAHMDTHCTHYHTCIHMPIHMHICTHVHKNTLQHLYTSH